MPSNVQEAGDLPRLGGLGEEPRKFWTGQEARNGPFAEAGTDPQGSLRRSQPLSTGNGSPAVPPHSSRRGSGDHGGAWRRAPETAMRGGAQALAAY